MRKKLLFAASGFLLATLGCREAVLDPVAAGAIIENWKRECGLVWVLNLEPDLEVNVQVSGRTGELIRYGGGTNVGRKRLISPFCRSDIPAVRSFNCQVISTTGKPFSGRIEAWYLGSFLKGWDLKEIQRFEDQVALPPQL